MDHIAKQFINESEENKKLFINAIVFKNTEKLKNLEKNFNDFLFKIYFCSYIKKSINFAANEIKKKESKISERENLCLNVTDPNFVEERINIIPDNDETDFIEDICKPKEKVDFNEIFYDKRLLESIKVLTYKQKEIIYECIIKDRDEKLVAKELGISKQAVNKIKNTALNKLRKKLGGI